MVLSVHVFICLLSLFRLNRMHEMHPIVTDDRGGCVCLSVCLSRSSSGLHCVKMAEQIKMMFGVKYCVRRGS